MVFGNIRIFVGLMTIILLISAYAEAASQPKSLGAFGGWQTFMTTENGQNICYMALRTSGTIIKKTKRGPVVLMITQRPADSSFDVVSYNAGYNFKAASDLRITFGGTNFDLFTQKDTAWSRDSMTDHALATAIRKNSTLTALGSPSTRAGAVKDTIALKGAADAYQAIGKACGMEVEIPQKPTPQAKSPLKKKKS